MFRGYAVTVALYKHNSLVACCQPIFVAEYESCKMCWSHWQFLSKSWFPISHTTT